jgi:hypothetical protein
MDGVNAGKAIETLTGCITAAKNLTNRVALPGMTLLASRQADYIAWVEVTEMELTNLTHDAEVLAMPYPTAYWEIVQLTARTPRGIAVIEAEIRRQIAGLEDLRDDLKRRLECARAAPGHITVLDTNVLLHRQLPDSVN